MILYDSCCDNHIDLDKERTTINIDLEKALGFNLYRTALLFRRELMTALSEYEMTPEQWQVMAMLWNGKELTQVEIAELTLKDKHSVSRIVQRLVNKGWIKKYFNPQDGRSTLIRPTKKGWKFQDEVPKKLLDYFEPIHESIGSRNRQQLLDLLKQVRTILGDKC